jgi:hypothetical protein
MEAGTGDSGVGVGSWKGKSPSQRGPNSPFAFPRFVCRGRYVSALFALPRNMFGLRRAQPHDHNNHRHFIALLSPQVPGFMCMNAPTNPHFSPNVSL